MAATELFKESADGHANSMGTCYSAEKKTSSSSSLSSARSVEALASHPPSSTRPAPARSSPRSSNTGKARLAQNSSFSRPQQASGRSTSTGKDCRTSLANASMTSRNRAHTLCEKSQPSLARNLSSEDHACAQPKDSQQARELRTHHTCTNSDVSDTGSASRGFDAGTSKPIPPHTERHNTLPSISRPRNSQRLASSRGKQDDLPAAKSRVGEIRAPPLLHKVNSLSLKSGVGPYEVLTPRKPVEGLQGTTPRNSGSRLLKSVSFSPLGTKDQGTKGLCKNCKTSNLDSICFIANDGKIAAANILGPATICHFHHCNSPKCAANPNYHPPSSLPCKKVVSKIQPVLSQPARTKSVSNDAKDDRIVFASLRDDDIDSTRCTQLCREDDHIDAQNACLVSNQGGKGSSSNEQPSVLMQGVDTQDSCSENGPSNVVAPPQSSCDANDDVVQSSPIGHEGVQIIDSYDRDNELSCSNDGIETPTTPKRSTKGAFGDLSNTEFAQANTAKASQARKSGMERMRQKYLDSLKEQEAETVRLKKQEMNARKQAGEWMLDCAMGEILHKLAPDGEAGVKVLVEAFETIIQHSDVEAHNEEHAAHECIGLEDPSKALASVT